MRRRRRSAGRPPRAPPRPPAESDQARGRSRPISAKIVIRGLQKAFKTRRGTTEALAGIDLTIGDSEFLCIVGPSGCGKTTLLRILAGLETQSAGEVAIAQDDRTRPLNSMVFQEHSLFPWMTVLDNAAFGLETRGMGRRERHERAMRFLEVVGLTRFRDHYPNQLSGGMKQRVSLVRAFVTDPEVLLMDEPFAALDAQNKVLLQDELVRIWEASRKTVVYITHSIEEALALGDRIVVMTSAPGRLKDSIDVHFPRPRDIFHIRTTPEFGAISGRIWEVLESEVRNAREAQR
jgi:NitT/TauT family transport system ATP-binding protein